MRKAARAIIIQGSDILVMRRNKQKNDYYTLVGGQVKEGESVETALIREVKEETGLEITHSRLVFVEQHQPPYNEQHIFLCEIIPKETVAIQEFTEEAILNTLDYNIHEPLWVPIHLFSQLAFYTPRLQAAISTAISQGFSDEPITL